MCTHSKGDFDPSELEEIIQNGFNPSDLKTANTLTADSVCKKCGCNNVWVSLNNKNEYCSKCFLNTLTHKFRATIGKSKLVRQNDSILIAHSGKANSTVLVHMIMSNTNESASKKHQCQYKSVYIDDGIVKGHTIEQRGLFREALAKEAERIDLTTYTIALSKSLTNITSEDVHLISEIEVGASDEDAILQKIFNDLQSMTEKDELLQQLKQKLYVSVALKLKCNKIFVGDTSMHLAIRVLEDISTGRGAQLPFNIAFCDTRYADVMLLRPLREFTNDDILGYMNYYNLHPVLDSVENAFPSTSVKNITKNFIYQLNNKFCGTVSTIYRTSEKLATRLQRHCNLYNNIGIDTDDTCVICQLSIDTPCSSGEQISVEQAKQFSEMVSTNAAFTTNIAQNTLDVCKRLGKQTIDPMNALKMQECQCPSQTCSFLYEQIQVEKHLCYSCRLVFFNFKKMEIVLPTFVLNLIKKKMRVSCLRDEIADFLL